MDEVQEYLSNLSREKLVETLVSQAMNDGALLRTPRLEQLLPGQQSKAWAWSIGVRAMARASCFTP